MEDSVKRKPIPGYEPYEADTLGNIFKSSKHDIPVNPRNKKGYLYIDFGRKGKQVFGSSTLSVHRAVALTFIPTDDTTLEINHIDANKQNNKVSNLEWCTHQENMQHAGKLGLLSQVGSDNPSAVYSDDTIHQICEKLVNGESLIGIARQLGINVQVVSKVKHKRNWSHISDQYDFSNIRGNFTPDDDLVHKVCKMVSEGVSDRDVGRKLGVCHRFVSRVRRKKYFTRISDLYY